MAHLQKILAGERGRALFVLPYEIYRLGCTSSGIACRVAVRIPPCKTDGGGVLPRPSSK